MAGYRGSAVGRRFIVDDFGNIGCYRRCSSCYHWLLAEHGNFSPRRRDPESQMVIRWDAYCRPCRNEANRKRLANQPAKVKSVAARRRWQKIKADPVKLERRRKQNVVNVRNARQRDPKRDRETQRRYMARLKADPEKWAAYLDRHRINYRLRAEREGREVTRQVPGASNAYRPRAGGSSDRMLPAEPFREWLTVLMREHTGPLDISLKTGIGERVIRRILNEAHPTVTMTTADCALTHYGRSVPVNGYGPVTFLWDLWPELAT